MSTSELDDPVLHLHRVDGTDDVYDVGSVVSPGSIRDQILRASLLTKRLHLAERIGAGADLLIVGGGPAGVAAALLAAELGVQAELVSADRDLFPRQRACKTRWIDPSVYEWPGAHHSDTQWGHSPAIPLPYVARRASDIVARDWVPKTLGRLPHARLGYQVRNLPKAYDGRLHAEVFRVGSDDAIGVTCAACIIAGGPGDEVVTAGGYRGYEFWEDDPYDAALPDPCRALVAGGGDGALQDLLRLLFDPARFSTPRDMLGLLARLSESDLRRLQTAEDLAARRLIWHGGRTERDDDHSALVELHETHREIAARLASDPPTAALIASALRSPLPEVTFAHPCTHFSRCFALNRFMALLALEVLVGRIRYLPNHGVRRVEGVASSSRPPHACVAPHSCHGADHEAELAPLACSGWGRKSETLMPFNVVVIRVGVGEPSHPRIARLRVRRHVLPYRLV